MSLPPSRSGPLRRWAGFATANPWRVLGGWLAIFLILGTLAATVGGKYADEFAVPGAESQQALDTLLAEFPQAAGDSAQVVFHSDAGVEATRAEIDAFVTEAANLPEVLFVASPFDSGTISENGQTAYATVQYDKEAMDIDPASIDALLELVEHSSTGPLQVEVGGSVIQELPETGISEVLGIVVAVIVLLIMFGSIIAMGLPIVTAVLGVGASVLLTLLGATFIDFSTITPALLSMLGLGVGIDYALFIMTRFREERAAGREIRAAAITATDTAGRAVLFAGTVVVIALVGLFVTGIPFIGFLGVGAAVAVVMAMLIAVGLMPALLVLLGNVMDRWAFTPNTHKPVETKLGYRTTAQIQKAPLAWLIGGIAFLLVLGAPAIFNAQLGSADAGTAPADSTSRKAYDLIAEGFGPGSNGPLLLVIESESSSLDTAIVDQLSSAIWDADGVQFVSPANINEAGTVAVLQVIPETAPQDSATLDLIEDLREDVIPGIVADTGVEVSIGGATATFADLATATSSRLPAYILVVAGLSVLILMAVFRSVLIPIKAAVLNLLSFFAGYGVLVLVFQEGFLGLNELIGLDRTGPIESFLPIFVFSILFGLSMDYEIFLMSRVHESWNQRKDNAWALRHGIGESGRVVLAAGAIMTSVFLAFALGPDRAIKEVGIGLGVAIAVDVLVVRMILVPAFMSLAGDRNWWFPGWLDRILPRLDVEGEAPIIEDGQPEREIPVGAPA